MLHCCRAFKYVRSFHYTRKYFTATYLSRKYPVRRRSFCLTPSGRHTTICIYLACGQRFEFVSALNIRKNQTIRPDQGLSREQRYQYDLVNSSDFGLAPYDCHYHTFFPWLPSSTPFATRATPSSMPPVKLFRPSPTARVPVVLLTVLPKPLPSEPTTPATRQYDR